MITRATGIPNFPFYTNFQPVFDSMKRFTSSYSRLLQTGASLHNPTVRPTLHINPRSLEGMVRNSSVGKKIDVVG
jgi:hypothetical protein